MALGQYAIMLISFGAMVALARLLEPEDFGIFAMAYFFFTLLDVTGKLGLDYSLMHRQETAGATLPTHFLTALSLSGASLVVMAIAALALPNLGYEAQIGQALLILGIFGSVQAMGITSQIVLEKELRFHRTVPVSVTSLLVANLLAIYLAWAGWGPWSLVAREGISMALLTLGMGILSPWAFWKKSMKFDGEVARWFLRYGLRVTLGSIATIGLLQFDNFLVGSIIGMAALGFYDRAYRLARLPTGLVTHIASRVSLPVYAQVQNDRPRLSFAFRLTLEAILALSLPIAIILFAAAPEVVSLLLGDRWLPAVPLLRLLAAYMVLRPLQDDVGALFSATGQPGTMSFILVIEALALVTVATPLTIALGSFGTALGVDIAFALGVVLAYWRIKNTVDLAYLQVFLPSGASALAGLAAWFAVVEVFDLSALHVFARFIIIAVTVLLVYTGFLAAIDRRRLRERAVYLWNLARGASAPQDVPSSPIRRTLD